MQFWVWIANPPNKQTAIGYEEQCIEQNLAERIPNRLLLNCRDEGEEGVATGDENEWVEIPESVR